MSRALPAVLGVLLGYLVGVLAAVGIGLLFFDRNSLPMLGVTLAGFLGVGPGGAVLGFFQGAKIATRRATQAAIDASEG